MQKTILALSAGLMIAGCATAQYPSPPPPPYGAPMPPHGGWDRDAFWRGAPESPRERIDFLQDRINRGIGDGSLDRYEGQRVNGELNKIREWLRQAHWEDGGRRLTGEQQAHIQDRLDRLSSQIRWARHNGW